MSKQWYAFFKRATAYVVLSTAIVLTAYAADNALPKLSLNFKQKVEGKIHVGDGLAYDLLGGDPNWKIDPNEGGLKKGYLFKPGKIFIPLAAGKFQIPSLTVLDESGNTVASTDPFEFEALSNFKDEGKGEPPKPEPPIGPVGLPFPVWIQTAVAFSILAVLLMGGFFLLRAIQRRAAKALKSILPKKPYDLAALERLDALIKQDYIQKGQQKKLSFGISETIKFYLAERFSIDAQESTTSELINLLRENMGKPGINDSLVSKVIDLFDRLDPIKFANTVPTEKEASKLYSDAREIITSTRKVTVEPIVNESVKDTGGLKP